MIVQPVGLTIVGVWTLFKMFKLIFGIIKWAIRILVLILLLVFPIIVFNEDPFTFYWDKIVILFEVIKNSDAVEKVINFFR